MWTRVITCLITCDFGTCSCEIFVREGNALTAYATRAPIKKKKLQRHEDKHNNVMITSFAFVLFRSVNPVQANAGRPWKSRSILQRIAGKIASGICQSHSSKREKSHTPREVLAQNICPRNSNKATTSRFICARANYHPRIHLWECADKPSSFDTANAFHSVMEALVDVKNLHVIWENNYARSISFSEGIHEER